MRRAAWVSASCAAAATAAPRASPRVSVHAKHACGQGMSGAWAAAGWEHRCAPADADCRPLPPAADDLKVTFENSAGGADLDWAQCSCSCPYAKEHEVCKHSLALLLARLSPADWVAAGGDPAAAEADPAPAPAPAPAAAAGAAAAARAAAAGGSGGGAPAAARAAAAGGSGGGAPAAARPAASQGSGQGPAPRKRVLPASLLAPK